MLLIWWQEEHPAHKKLEWWGAGVVICLEQGANDLHMVQLMQLPSHHFCFSKIWNGTGSPRQSQTKGHKTVVIVVQRLMKGCTLNSWLSYYHKMTGKGVLINKPGICYTVKHLHTTRLVHKFMYNIPLCFLSPITIDQVCSVNDNAQTIIIQQQHHLPGQFTQQLSLNVHTVRTCTAYWTRQRQSITQCYIALRNCFFSTK